MSAAANGQQATFVFAYGSLMWRPGFRYERAARARLVGWRRCFCVASTHHRGTAKRPGLVLGLDRGGSCLGIAYELPPDEVADILAYLRAREQVNGVYREAQLQVMLEDGSGREVWALCFVVERQHPSYAGTLPLARQAALIRGASGVSGLNVDYLVSTLAHLEAEGIAEPALRRVMTLIGPHFARALLPDGRSRSGRALRAAVAHRRLDDVPRMRPTERRRFVYRVNMAASRAPRPSTKV